jgi:hypothetical protein
MNDLWFYCFQRRETTKSKEKQQIVYMPPPKNPQHIQVFNGMAQFYRCFIQNFIIIMTPIINLNKKTKTFL